MFFIRVVLFTVIFYIILNFSAIRRGAFKKGSLILPFSLGLAFTIIDSFMRFAFYYSLILFILISCISYGALTYIARRR